RWQIAVSLQTPTSVQKRVAGIRPDSIQTAASLRLDTHCGHLPRRPPNGVNHPLVKSNSGLPPQNLARSRNICFRVALFARTCRLITDLILSARPVKGGQDEVGQLVNGKTSAAEIEDSPVAGGVFESTRPRLHHVGDIHEVPGLLAVAENGDRLASDHVPQENPQYTLIRIVQ